MRGTIALDIDGTLTTNGMHLPRRTLDYLSSLATSGWRFIFITGRPYHSGIKALKDVPFTYYLAVQNGAIILEMPSRHIVGKKYLDRSIFHEMEAICDDDPSDFVIYGGFENEDCCYFRPKHFSEDLLEYLHRRISTYEETWHAVESYEEVDIDMFPSVKCFGKLGSAKVLADRIEKRLGLHVPIIRDTFSNDHYVIQATHANISKGHALKDLIALTGERGKVIAAGDDLNDLPMLAAADIKIVMSTAPQEMLSKGDIIAPAAMEEGIIIGLEAAIKHAGNYRI